MEKCLTQTERQEKKTAIRYLRGELKERLDYLNGEPDNLCKAYQTIIESMQRQKKEKKNRSQSSTYTENCMSVSNVWITSQTASAMHT